MEQKVNLHVRTETSFSILLLSVFIRFFRIVVTFGLPNSP